MAQKIASDRPLGRHFIREWRDFKGLSQEKLAERIGATAASLSRIENNLQPYSQEFLEATAEALGCDAADLLNVNPLIPRGIDILAHYRQADPVTQEAVRRVLNIAPLPAPMQVAKTAKDRRSARR